MTFFAPERTATERFVIRSFLPGDGAAIHEATIASYEHLRTYMPWAVPAEDPAVTEKRARAFRAAYLLDEDFPLLVVGPDGRVLGGTGFHLRHGGLHTSQAEIGMWIRSSEAGSGLGTAVLREMVRWGFDAWPWRRLLWGCNADNLASRRVAEKCGFRLEARFRAEFDAVSGETRDGVLYALCRDEHLVQVPTPPTG